MNLPQLARHDEAEKAILAGILAGIPFDFSALSPQDFHDPLQRRLYARMQSMAAFGEPLNLLAVTEPMKLDAVELACVGKLLDSRYGPFSEKNVASYVRLVRDAARHRQLQAAAENFVHSLDVGELIAAVDAFTGEQDSATSTLGSYSTGELFQTREKTVDWNIWPVAAVGFASVIDALPKVGKTVLLLRGIHASRMKKSFLGHATKPVRVVYVSEQSAASLAMQMREIGFDGSEPIEELRLITREHWSRFIYTDFLRKLEKEILQTGSYNMLAVDTFHTIARMEDERDASEVNRLGNLTLDVASRNNLGLTLGRHDRKSGGDVGVSGRNSIQLSGLVDVIVHVVRTGGPNQRRLELVGRVPGLPAEQTIELINGEYMNWGEPKQAQAEKEAEALDALLQAEPTVGYRSIKEQTGISKNRVKKVAESIGWYQNEGGQWQKRKPS